MRLASRLGLPMIERRDVYLASLVRDLGGTACSALIHAGTGGDDRHARRDYGTQQRRPQHCHGKGCGGRHQQCRNGLRYSFGGEVAHRVLHHRQGICHTP